MSAFYQLDIMTPKRRFFSEQVGAMTVYAPDGALCVLAGHAPLVSALAEGSVSILTLTGWREAFHSEGFMEVTPSGVTIFAQVCEWAEDIDAVRAQEAKLRAEEHLRQKRSTNEYRSSQISLARALARLRIKDREIDLD